MGKACGKHLGVLLGLLVEPIGLLHGADAVHLLHVGNVLPHTPSGDALLEHLVELGGVTLGRLGHIEPGNDAGDGTGSREQECGAVVPVCPMGID